MLQEAFEILTKYEAEVTKREAEGVFNLRHFFTKLQSKAVSIIIVFIYIFIFFGFIMCSSETFWFLSFPEISARRTCS